MTWRETIAKAGAYLQAKAVPDAQVAAVQSGLTLLAPLLALLAPACAEGRERLS